MPGVIAIAGRIDPAWVRLHSEFRAIWGNLEIHEGKQACVAAHAHRGKALFRDVHGHLFSVDGEAGIYRPRQEIDLRTENLFAWLSDTFLQLGPECKGNVVVPGLVPGEFHFASEWTGTFPLYYLQLDDSLLVSSHLRPLVRATQALPDMTGVFEYLRFSYNIAGRTLFKNIRRVLPGQAFRYQLDSRQLDIKERSRLWSGVDFDEHPAETAWSLLRRGVSRSIGEADMVGLMLSGGWDSRTLLAVARDELGPERLRGYSHGDTRSRELRLVERIADEAGIRCQLQEIDDTAYEIDALRAGFARVESVVFPHWHRAGVLLAECGAKTAAAGVYGEILGGHYGPAMRVQGMAKILAVGRGLLGLTSDTKHATLDELISEGTRLFSIRSLPKPWAVNAEAWPGASDILEEINEDIARAIRRLVERGIKTQDQLVEAFITEHRGTQYINMQLLSCRASVDVSLPFTDQASLSHACAIPLSKKIHNRLNQSMLAVHNPSLLEIPLAATLTKANRPIYLQEISRLIRRGAEDAHWKLHYLSPGRIPSPSLGWVNFEFLRTGKALGGIADSLSAGIWDKDAIESRLRAIKAGDRQTSLHPISDALMKVCTVDSLLH